MSENPSAADLMIVEPPVCTEETSDLPYLHEIVNEATLRGLRAQWGRVGQTNDYWIEVPCDSATMYIIKHEARRHVNSESKRSTRERALAAARKRMMDAGTPPQIFADAQEEFEEVAGRR